MSPHRRQRCTVVAMPELLRGRRPCVAFSRRPRIRASDAGAPHISHSANVLKLSVVGSPIMAAEEELEREQRPEGVPVVVGAGRVLGQQRIQLAAIDVPA